MGSDVGTPDSTGEGNSTGKGHWRKWECLICGWVYSEEKGDPDSGIAPGTAWEDVPDDWLCPDCGVGKDDFMMIELES